ncbi:MAG: hypothetical protein KGJ86_17590, partial [Chloroflexota bacterium]|nr:hypothetical protein [Chloroflexota bacterium]
MIVQEESPRTAHQEWLARLREETEQRHGKSTAELWEERERRIADAVALREPDRTPVVFAMGNFPARYMGVPLATAYYDAPAFRRANMQTIVDLEPDGYRQTAGGNAGDALSALDAKQFRWPGGNLPPDVAYQFVESEPMKEDEYDLFVSDPTDFILRYYLPRVFGALQPLAQLPPL